jgi:hypothetical protein
MEPQTNEVNCHQCNLNNLCKPHKDAVKAIGEYNLITATPGKVWTIVMAAMAENCRYYDEVKDGEQS